MDEKQLAALIDAAVREAVERTTQQLTAKFETDTAGLRKNRDDLLAEKKDGEGKQRSWEEVTADFDKHHAESTERVRKLIEQGDRLMGKSSQPVAPSVTEHTISREDARYGERYREAKAAAEKAGVPLRIVDEHAPPPQQRSSPVKFVKDPDSGTLFVNAEMIARHGQARCRQIAAEQGAPTMRAFRSVDDLPKPMQQAHAQAMAERSNLLGDQQ